MSGVSVRHDRIVRNVARLVDRTAAGTPCEPFSSDVKVRVADRFYYPDVMLRCGDPLPDDALWVTDPHLLVEVTSPGTRDRDRREKRLAYCALPSLATYLIVAHSHRSVERWWRDAGGAWQFEEITGTGEVAIDGPTPMALALDAIYAGTDVPERRLRRLRERTTAAYSAAPSTAAAVAATDRAPGA
jgi:Uma2 family endonuclease